MGPEHLAGLDTIIDPVVVSELPTVLWCPHGHDEAVTALRGITDVILLDSDDCPTRTRGSRARGGAEVGVRCRPRVAAHDPVARAPGGELRPARAPAGAGGDRRVHDPPPVELDRERAAARRLARVAPALGHPAAGRRRTAPACAGGPTPAARATSRSGSRRPTRRCRGSPESPCACEGFSLSLDRAEGGLRAHEAVAGHGEHSWQVLGASRGEGGILGEGVRQALLRDPTYGPALEVARGFCAHAA